MYELDKNKKDHPNRVGVLNQYFYRFKCNEDLTKDSFKLIKEMDYNPNKGNETSFEHRLERSDKLKIIQAWANRSAAGQHHHWHNHPNSFLSAVFYLTDSPMPTTFAIGDIWSPQKNFSGNLDLNVRSHIAPIYHKEETVAGNLILFPSVVDHCVDSLQEGMEDRYTISFNTFPVGTIGSYSSLAGLTIEVDCD